MAKKWKAYPWPDRVEEPAIDIEEEEEIDVVGDSPGAIAASGKTTVTASCWGPSSPTAGATAPSPPPHSPEATRGSTILYNGKLIFYYLIFVSCFYYYMNWTLPSSKTSSSSFSNSLKKKVLKV